MKTAIFWVLPLALASCKMNQSAEQKEFAQVPGKNIQVNASYDLKLLTSTLSEQTKVSAGKMTFHAEVLQGVSSEDKPDGMNVYTEIYFSNLSEDECNALKAYHSQGYKHPSEVDCKRPNRNFFTTDFLPPAMQALEKHQFRKQTDMSGEVEAGIMANCWTTSYEIARHRATGGLDFSVFYVGNELVETYFQDPAYFQKVGESPTESSLSFVVKSAKPGDLLQFYRERIFHSAVVVAPGLIFEKSGFQSAVTYRLALLEDLLQVWGFTDRVVLMRPTGKALPHPNVFRSGDMGGNSRYDSGSREYDFIIQLPPFVKKPDGRFHLPPEAYQSSTFKLKSMEGSPLKELKRIDKEVSVDCVTKGNANLFESNEFEPSDKVFGTTPAGTKFYSRYQYGSFYQLLSFMYKGEMHDPRAMNALWIDAKDVTCTPRVQ